jgi:hypothetical protein
MRIKTLVTFRYKSLGFEGEEMAIEAYQILVSEAV